MIVADKGRRVIISSGNIRSDLIFLVRSCIKTRMNEIVLMLVSSFISKEVIKNGLEGKIK